MNTTTNTPTFTTANALAKHTVAEALPLLQDLLAVEANTHAMDDDILVQIFAWKAISQDERKKFDLNAFKFVFREQYADASITTKSPKGETVFTSEFRAGEGKEMFAKFSSTVKALRVSELQEATANTRAMESMVAKLINAFAEKASESMEQRSLINSELASATIDALVLCNVVAVRTALSGTKHFTIHPNVKAAVMADNGRLRDAIIERRISSKLGAFTAPQKEKQLLSATSGSTRGVDTRSSMFSNGTESKAFKALAKATSTGMRLNDSFFDEKNDEGETQAERVINSLVGSFIGHRTAADSLNTPNGQALVEVYTKNITKAVMDRRGVTFFRHLMLDFAGRMHSKRSLLDVENKAVRSFLEVADGYAFDQKSKVAAVAKLRENLVLNGTLKSRMSMAQVEANFKKTLKSVTVTNKKSATLIKGAVDPLSKRLLNSLIANDKTVHHMVGLDVTNQSSQNTAVVLGDSKLFAYTGADLDNTAYAAFAEAFKQNALLLNLVKAGPVLDELMCVPNFKYRFMTVGYNRAIATELFGSDKDRHERYASVVLEGNKNKRAEDKVTPLALGDVDANKVPKFLATETSIAAEKKFKAETPDAGLPLINMLHRNKVLITSSTTKEDLENAYTAAINEISPAILKFKKEYANNFFGEVTKGALTVEYTSQDGFNVMISRKTTIAEVLVTTQMNGDVSSLTTHRVTNLQSVYIGAKGTPVFMQSIDAAQARSAVLDADAVTTMHDEYFFRLCDVEAGITNHTNQLIELMDSGYAEDHCVEANMGHNESSVLTNPLRLCGDGKLTAEIIAQADFKLWF